MMQSFAPLMAYFPGNSATFWFWSSAICLAFGVVHLVGLDLGAGAVDPLPSAAVVVSASLASDASMTPLSLSSS